MQHRRIIKQGPVVLATREDGSMDPSSTSSQGLFLGDTRFLSLFQIRLDGLEPVLLGSTEEILFQSSFLLTNPELKDLPPRGVGVLQRNTIAGGCVVIEVTVANWSLRAVDLDLSVEIDADFFDSFEARGVKRLKRGEIREPRAGSSWVQLEYLGLDNVARTTHIEVMPNIGRFENHTMHFPVSLKDTDRSTIRLEIKMMEKAPQGTNLHPRPEVARTPKPHWFDDCSKISTSNVRVDAVVQRSVDDLEVLLTEWQGLWVPAAGLPRFSVPFGRDSLITGLETLTWNPKIARDVLKFLATTQGTEENPWNYEQPGKIMHEMHTGELARLKEIPFGLFYGSVDSTPLFLMLGAEYIRWTGDLELYRELKPNFEAAWKWIDDYGHINDDSYIQYQAHTPPRASSAALTVGLFNQGWKDSSTAVMYSDGTMVTDHPISLSEVQGDLYRALHVWAEVYSAMPESEGMAEEGRKLHDRAARLKEKFNREFWMADKRYYAMALDGHGRQVDTITSNPGWCLWTRLIDDKNAEDMVATLMDDSMFSSWGLRTMASTEKSFNPFSYHDGSVWPFENAIIAAGLKKYGFVVETQRVFDALIDASRFFEYSRWPEVYCGVSESIGGVLARQPDASRPQAWSAGAALFFIQIIFGIAARPFARHVDVTPALPTAFREISVDNMLIAGSRLSLRLVRDGNAVLVDIKHNPDDLDIVIHPATRRNSQLEQGPAVSG